MKFVLIAVAKDLLVKDQKDDSKYVPFALDLVKIIDAPSLEKAEEIALGLNDRLKNLDFKKNFSFNDVDLYFTSLLKEIYSGAIINLRSEMSIEKDLPFEYFLINMSDIRTIDTWSYRKKVVNNLSSYIKSLKKDMTNYIEKYNKLNLFS